MSPPGLNGQLRSIVERYLAAHPDRRDDARLVFEHWSDTLSMGDRKTFPGHFTASAIVVSGRRVLLVKHGTFGIWLQPGGHLEPGEAPCHAAMRELLEETGITGQLLSEDPIDLDCHLIPANPKKSEPEHFHFDLRYRVAPLILDLRIDPGEVDAAAWVDFGDVTSLRLRSLLREGWPD